MSYIKSELGKELCKAYRHDSLKQIADWAEKAAEILETAVKNELEGDSKLDPFYSKALQLQREADVFTNLRMQLGRVISGISAK